MLIPCQCAVELRGKYTKVSVRVQMDPLRTLISVRRRRGVERPQMSRLLPIARAALFDIGSGKPADKHAAEQIGDLCWRTDWTGHRYLQRIVYVGDSRDVNLSALAFTIHLRRATPR